MKFQKTATALLLVTSLSLVTVHAATIASWDATDLEISQETVTIGTLEAGVSGSQLAVATSADPGSTFNPNASWPNALVGIQNNLATNSLATSQAAEDYFTFTVTPDAGQQVSYTSLFMEWSLGTNTPQPSEVTYALTSEVDGFATSLDTVVAVGTTAFETGSGTFTFSGLDNISTPVEFRIYVYNTGANPGTRIGIGTAFNPNTGDDLRLEGTISPNQERPLEITAVSHDSTADSISFTWNSEQEVRYYLDVWNDSTWEELADDLLGAGLETSYTLPNVGTDEQIYRIREQ